MHSGTDPSAYTKAGMSFQPPGPKPARDTALPTQMQQTSTPLSTLLAVTGYGPKRRDESGFTLLEILVVIAILGLLIGLVAPAALRQLGGAKISIARQSIERLSTVLDLYRLEHRYHDGAWGSLEEQPRPHHAAAAHDPERRWPTHRIFRCTSCDHEVVLREPDGGPAEEA